MAQVYRIHKAYREWYKKTSGGKDWLLGEDLSKVYGKYMSTLHDKVYLELFDENHTYICFAVIPSKFLYVE